MLIAPLPDNEERRLARLDGLSVLDTLPQQAFDDISALAQAICGTPIALITLIDRDRQWFKSRIGVDLTETPREVAFCSHAILHPDEPMVIGDTLKDQRFSDNPLVSGPTQVRFYAGAPIVTDDGFALGSVCVIDQQPRELSPVQLDALRRLSALVATLLEHEKARKQESARTAEAVSRQHEELSAMAVAGLDLLVYVDRNCIHQHVNDTFLEYWACTREQVIGRSLQELVGEQVFKDVIQSKFECALAGQSSHYHRVTRFPGRGLRHVQVALIPARNSQGAITGVVLRAQDVHEIRQREARLRETVSLLEQKTLQQERFIHMLSHDLREPINAINNFSSLLASDHHTDLPATGRKYLGFVRSGGARMGALLDDLLRFIQLDKHALATERVDLHSVMAQVQTDLAPVLTSGNGKLEVLELPFVQGDPALLCNLLRNLVANGLQFTQPGVPAHVRVMAERQAGFDLIHVEDNGIGIAPEHQDAVFDMLKRLHLRRAHPGSGLGLPIARRIASLHGGYLTLKSAPGKGSRFTLRLPLAHGIPNESPA